MKKLVISLFTGIVSISTIQSAKATINFFDDFSTYTNGNLVGQGPWLQTSTSATTPVQVNGGSAILGTSGQDVYAPLTSPILITDGSSFYIGATVNITSAQSGGDYFLHFTPTVGNSSIFSERLFVKSSSTGFVFGYDGSSGGTVNYGSTVLSLNTTYNIVMSYTGVSGLTNDTFSLYVNPTDTSTEGNNTAYLISGYIGTSAESTNVAAINLRQGSTTSAPSVIVDALSVGTTFAEVAPMIAPVPEPSTLAMTALGGVACLVAIRRRR